ncbi:hypothetical protein BDV12DRAFT_174842 [Aspergillus spectabilis]
MTSKMDRSNTYLTSLERKRFRYRKAQRTKKEKTENRIRDFEETLASCQRQHGVAGPSGRASTRTARSKALVGKTRCCAPFRRL